LVLPGDATITPGTGAVLTSDGRFCLIASSLDVPTVYSFDVVTGQLVSHLPLIGRPAEIALHDDGSRRMLAVASAPSNTLSIVRIDEQGGLTAGANFNPSIARFDDTNNPVFSSDGRLVYIAASTGDRLFAVDTEGAIIVDSISIASPARVSVITRQDGVEMVATTRIRRPSNLKAGGVTIVESLNGRLSTRSEFSPPDGVDFSGNNNVAMTSDGTTAFVGSATGILFAFNTTTGELESFQEGGNEIRRLALSEKSRTVAAVRSSSAGDEVSIINFDLVGSDETNSSAPLIDSIS